MHRISQIVVLHHITNCLCFCLKILQNELQTISDRWQEFYNNQIVPVKLNSETQKKFEQFTVRLLKTFFVDW